jgi:uncharacterized integral membrane protein
VSTEERQDMHEGVPGGASQPPEPAPDHEGHGRRERALRQGRNAWLYAVAVAAVVLIGILIAWVVANRGSVEVDWLLGTTDAALALVIFVAAAIGWVLGIATAITIRRRTTGGRGQH